MEEWPSGLDGRGPWGREGGKGRREVGRERTEGEAKPKQGRAKGKCKNKRCEQGRGERGREKKVSTILSEGGWWEGRKEGTDGQDEVKASLGGEISQADERMGACFGSIIFRLRKPSLVPRKVLQDLELIDLYAVSFLK